MGVTKVLTKNDEILIEIKRLFKSASKIKCAVAFWGKGASDLFSNSKAKSIEIVCNLMSGGTNPKEIGEIQLIKNVEVKMYNFLHAKVFWTDKGVVIGSANASANGLSLEALEIKGWDEVCVLIDDPKIIKDLEKWFDIDIWKNSKKIKDKDLANAKELWERKRTKRINTKKAPASFANARTYYENKNIYIVIDTKFMSEKQEEIGNALGEKNPLLNKGFSFWIDCDDSFIQNSYAFTFECKPKSSLKYEKFYKILPFKYCEKNDGHKYFFARKASLKEIEMSKKHEKELAEAFQCYIKKKINKIRNKVTGQEMFPIEELFEFIEKTKK